MRLMGCHGYFLIQIVNHPLIMLPFLISFVVFLEPLHCLCYSYYFASQCFWGSICLLTFQKVAENFFTASSCGFNGGPINPNLKNRDVIKDNFVVRDLSFLYSPCDKWLSLEEGA